MFNRTKCSLCGGKMENGRCTICGHKDEKSDGKAVRVKENGAADKKSEEDQKLVIHGRDKNPFPWWISANYVNPWLLAAGAVILIGLLIADLINL